MAEEHYYGWHSNVAPPPGGVLLRHPEEEKAAYIINKIHTNEEKLISNSHVIFSRKHDGADGESTADDSHLDRRD